MKRFAKILILCMILFVGCAFTLPAQMGTLEAHAVSKVKISKTKATLIKGKTLQLKVKGTKKKAKWSSNKKSVATVSKTGKVKAKKAGNATITAKIGKKKYKCKITVKNPPNCKKLIVGMWEGKWEGGYAEFEFTKSGHFYFSYGDKYGYNSTDGSYWVKGKKLELDTGEIYTIKSISKRFLTIKTYLGTYKLHRVSV